MEILNCAYTKCILNEEVQGLSKAAGLETITVDNPAQSGKISLKLLTKL